MPLSLNFHGRNWPVSQNRFSLFNNTYEIDTNLFCPSFLGVMLQYGYVTNSFEWSGEGKDTAGTVTHILRINLCGVAERIGEGTRASQITGRVSHPCIQVDSQVTRHFVDVQNILHASYDF